MQRTGHMYLPLLHYVKMTEIHKTKHKATVSKILREKISLGGSTSK